MALFSSPSLRAFAALAVVAGCSVSVQPIRSPAPSLREAKKVSAPTVVLEPIDPDKPVPMCPDPAPPPATERSAAAFVVQNGHSRRITKMALSDDGRVLATGALDGTVRVWDTRTGLMLRKVGAPGAMMYDLALSGRGDRLAYYAPDGSPDGLKVRVVDLDTGGAPRPLAPFAGPFKLSTDGKQLVAALQSLTVHDASMGNKIHEVDLKTGKYIALALALDPAGHRAAVAIPGEVMVVDVRRGVLTQRIRIAAATYGDTPLGIAFAHDAVLVRTALETITAYPIETGKPPRVFPDSHADMAVSGDRLWTVDKQTRALRAFALGDGSSLPVTAADPAMGTLLAASTDRSTLVLSRAGNDGIDGISVDVRDVGTMRTIRTIEGRAMSFSTIAMRADGAEMAISSPDGRVARWNLREGSLQLSHSHEDDTSQSIALAYDRSGEHLISTTGNYPVRVREAKTGRTLRRWKPKEGFHLRFAAPMPGTDELLTVRVRSEPVRKDEPKPTAQKPAVPQPQKPPEMRHEAVLERWDLGAPLPRAASRSTSDTIAPPPGKEIGQASFLVTSGLLSADGASLALTGGGGELALMRTQTGALAWKIQQQIFNMIPGGERDGDIDKDHRWLAFSPDGKTLHVSTREIETQPNRSKIYVPVLLVFDAATGAVKAKHRMDTFGPLAWRGDTVAIGGPRPAMLDAKTLAVRARVTVPDSTIDTIAVHPKLDLFLFGGDTGATSLVTPKGEVAVTLLGTSNGEWVAATPEGAYRSSLDGARSIAWAFSSPLEGFSFERFATRFENPDLVMRRLSGDLAPAPASLSRPPRLTIEGARSAVRTTERTIKLTAETSSGSRVDRVRAFVDGRPVADQLVCAREGTVSLDVPLHAGQNRVSLVAYDAEGYGSNTQQIDVVSTSTAVERPDLYVVAMGVSRYPNMPEEQQLEYADDDARSIAESFGREAGPGRTFARLRLTTLLDDQVTVEGVDRALASLQSMRPDDLAVVFFAGHGARLEEGKMVFLTSRAAFTRSSAQANGIDWDRIQTGLSRVRGRVLMLLDACHSGYVSTAVIAPNEQLARELAAGDRAGVLVFSAARGSQYSYEVPPQGAGGASRGFELAWEGQKPSLPKALPGGHGLFTSAVLEALGGGAPDRDRSGAIEVGELFDYVTERVRAASNGKQTPWVARREMFGEFMLAPAGR
ncbi:caspase family protein [Polyangium aurulentum]|uniref:caspase family protein n=1 Tax=Polyangium aurulentum TaxID=2567896 RepID=UPI0010AE5F48|nr:caspase family protein [Polyangium aurulentum]UQA59270.1 caspase family protein [Polyangium aurulentum]